MNPLSPMLSELRTLAVNTLILTAGAAARLDTVPQGSSRINGMIDKSDPRHWFEA